MMEMRQFGEIMTWLRTGGYQDWSDSWLFHPTKNPIPLPKFGQRSGFFGWIEVNDEKPDNDDYDELQFLIENDYGLYQAQHKDPACQDYWRDYNEGNSKPVRYYPGVIAFIKRNFNRLAKPIYDMWGPQRPSAGHADDPYYSKVSPWENQAKDVIKTIKVIYGDGPEGEKQLTAFLSRLHEGEREDFMEEAQEDDFVSFMRGFSDIIDKAKGTERVKPSRKVELKPTDIPSLDPQEVQRRKDEALDEYNAGELDDESFQEKMRELQRMGKFSV